MSEKKTFAEYVRSDAVESQGTLKDDEEQLATASSFKMALLKYRAWALPALLSLIVVLFTWPTTARVARDSIAESRSNVRVAEPPRNSTGLSDAVQWDNYTLFINDQRVFIS